MALEPELLYVNSKISDPTKLSPELFESWYNEVHIPDIFATSGIKQAFRYYTTAEDPNSIDRPYLALYPVKYPGYLMSAEYRGIPLKSDMLPGPNHRIFDVANFDSRYYALTSAAQPFNGPFLLTVQFEDAPSGDFQSVAFHKSYLTMQLPKAPEETELSTPPANLALMWFKDQTELESAADSMSNFDGSIAKFKLLKDFAAEEEAFH